ncbi:MAG: hypothetical protein VKK04_23950 [Synechococcales bacterium]|nr:hypothetical protein [Synechococcales bacterium]
MKLSFRGVVYESPFPTLEIIGQHGLDKDHEIIWRFQHLKAVRLQQYTAASTYPPERRFLSRDAILLAIWEPAPITEVRTRPFLYVAKYLLESEEDAQDVLSSYLDAYTANPVHPPARVFMGTRKPLSTSTVS